MTNHVQDTTKFNVKSSIGQKKNLQNLHKWISPSATSWNSVQNDVWDHGSIMYGYGDIDIWSLFLWS